LNYKKVMLKRVSEKTILQYCYQEFLSKVAMSSYRKPCKYCSQLVPPNAKVCPVCGKVNPLETRCPKCRTPIQTNWVRCSSCGLSLSINCPVCGKSTFFSDYCQNCGAQLVVECKKCHTIQPPISPKCNKCGKPL
jgi:RNA polymerase subunit RPABC4/transcription elongation factor Spt4